MSSESNSSNIAKNTTTGREWIVIGVIVLVVIILVLVMYLVYVPQTFQESSVNVPVPPGQGDPKCPTSVAPSNFSSIQNDLTEPTMDLAWDPILTTTTVGEEVLGYNIYISKNVGITEINKVMKTFSQVPQKRLRDIDAETEYFYKIATVDSCGVGELSTEEGSFTTAALP